MKKAPPWPPDLRFISPTYSVTRSILEEVPMKKFLALGMVLLAGGIMFLRGSADYAPEEVEMDTSLDAVPEHVLQAALEAVEGFEISEVEVEAMVIYEFEGVADGREVEIEVTEEGDVIEVEYEDEEDDDEGHAEDHDEGEDHNEDGDEHRG